MAKIVICDKCKKELKQGEGFSGSILAKRKHMENWDIDLCNECAKDVAEYIGTKVNNLGINVDKICEILVEMFDEPCNYKFNDIDVDEFMHEDDYCKHHCGYGGKGDCWKRFFEKYDKFSKENN